jgi:hypothetical protein
MPNDTSLSYSLRHILFVLLAVVHGLVDCLVELTKTCAQATYLRSLFWPTPPSMAHTRPERL